MALYLDGNNLSGGIPDSFSNLVNLKAIGVGNNPNLEINEFPELLFSLPELQQIRLENLGIAGPLSSGITALVELRVLYLEGNAMTGEFPDISNLEELVRLRLDGSSFEGDISIITSFPNLVQARLGGNSFGGEIPRDIGSLENLEELQLQGNPIGGEIPDSITRLGSLSKCALMIMLQARPFCNVSHFFRHYFCLVFSNF